jgi:putative membrane protein
MSNQRLHPLAILVYWLNAFKSAALPIFVIVFNTFDEGILVTASVLGIGIILLTVLAWLRYWFFSYDITADALVIHSGVFVKKHNHIPYARMQAVHHQQWFFLKPFQ